MSGETSALSVQRFDRGAVIAVVIAVLNRETQQNRKTNSPVEHSEKGASVVAVLTSKRQFETAEQMHAGRIDRKMAVIK